MATERKETTTQKELEKGLREYTRLASLIPAVAAVVVVPGPERDLFTYIDDRNEEAIEQLLDAEDKLFELFDDVLFDFHLVYLEGRPLRQMAPTSRKVVYSRAADA